MKRKLSLTTGILSALILGIVVGLLLQNHVVFANFYIKPLGTIFLNLLKFIVVPLVFVSITVGIISMNSLSSLGKLGVRALVYFMATTVAAVSLGLFVSASLQNVFPIIHINQSTSAVEQVQLTIMDQIVSFFPKNVIEPLSETLMMQIIVMAVVFGLAIVKVGEKAKPFSDFLASVNEVTVAILGFIMQLAPLGVFCLICPVVAENGPKIVGTYAALVSVDYLCFLLHALLVYAVCVWFLGKYSPWMFFRKMTPAMLFGFSSDSSIATLPVTTRCAESMGVRSGISNFVLPLGATINMDGVAIYLGVSSVFIAHCCGIDLTWGQYVSIAFASTVVSIGTPGIPGGSLALMAMVFVSAGLPVEGVAIIAGIDRIVDMGRTVMSVTGDASCAVIMERFERGKA